LSRRRGSGLGLPAAAVLSAVFGVILALVLFAVPLGIEYAASSIPIIGYLSVGALKATLTAFGLTVGVVTVGGVVVYLVWRAIPKTAQFGLAVALLIGGLLLFQPEADVVGVLGLIFAFYGGGAVRPTVRRR